MCWSNKTPTPRSRNRLCFQMFEAQHRNQSALQTRLHSMRATARAVTLLLLMLQYIRSIIYTCVRNLDCSVRFSRWPCSLIDVLHVRALSLLHKLFTLSLLAEGYLQANECSANDVLTFATIAVNSLRGGRGREQESWRTGTRGTTHKQMKTFPPIKSLLC